MDFFNIFQTKKNISGSTQRHHAFLTTSNVVLLVNLPDTLVLGLILFFSFLARIFIIRGCLDVLFGTDYLIIKNRRVLFSYKQYSLLHSVR